MNASDLHVCDPGQRYGTPQTRRMMMMKVIIAKSLGL
jgi:hypothetical protein